jgi:glutathione S-transferase
MNIELFYTPHTRSSRPRWLLEELAVSYRLGEQFTCADIMPGTTLAWLPGLLEDHPPLLACTARVTARPACRRAIE